MGRYTGPKVKICKRFGQPLFDKVDRWTARPGRELAQPRFRRTSKPSPYAEALMEKQKLKHIYGVLERQFRRFVKLAEKTKGNTGTNLLTLLERRLDNVMYRAGFAMSRSGARQIINHGHLQVNGKKVDIPSFLVAPDMEIAVRDREKSKRLVALNLSITKSEKLPSWLLTEGEGEATTVKVINLPTDDELEHQVDVAKVVELMSR